LDIYINKQSLIKYTNYWLASSKVTDWGRDFTKIGSKRSEFHRITLLVVRVIETFSKYRTILLTFSSLGGMLALQEMHFNTDYENDKEILEY